MAFVTSRNIDDVEAVCVQLDEDTKGLVDKLTVWRQAIAANSAADAQQTRRCYQALTSLRTLAEAKKGSPGLADVTRRRLNQPASYDPGAEWNATRAAINPLVTWVQANWPERTAAGKPAFDQFQATTAELESFAVPLATGPKNNLLGMIDAVLATIV